MASNIRIKDWSIDERPRERMMLYGAKGLNNSELLAILIRSGNSDHTAVDLAKALLKDNGNSLRNLSRMSCEELCRTKGIGESKASAILAAFELGYRIAGEPPEEKPQITCAADAVALMKPIMHNLPHEECWAVYLNRQNRVLHKECISKGGIHSTVMDPKIIIKKGIEKLATGIILYHNHPSGSPYPGKEDIRQTKLLKEASSLMEISLIDHIIIAGEKFYSFSENSGM